MPSPGAAHHRPHHRGDGRQGRRRLLDHQRTTSPGPSARSLDASTVLIVDLDIAFGTAGLDFNQDPPQGVADAVWREPEDGLDANLLDRLTLQAAAITLSSARRARSCSTATYRFPGDANSMQLIDLLRSAFHRRSSSTCPMSGTFLGPSAAPDQPPIDDQSSSSARAGPREPAQRQERCSMCMQGQPRPNDERPRLVLNQVGVPKRPEIEAWRVRQGGRLRAAGLSAESASTPRLFGTAANNGQMIAEVSGPRSTRQVEMFSA